VSDAPGPSDIAKAQADAHNGPPASAATDAVLARAAEIVSPAPDGARAYAGIVTRTVAFAIDLAIVEGVAALVGVTVGLAASLFYLAGWAEAVIGAILVLAWVLWSVSYFAFFWSTTGQTPGNRMMGIRVIDARERGPLKPRRAALRFGGVCLAAMPLGAGFLMMLWDDSCRCLQDHLARTRVIYMPSNKEIEAADHLPGSQTPTARRAAQDLQWAKGQQDARG
jgi:uncharacterized RDD family membrane protein YckC